VIQLLFALLPLTPSGPTLTIVVVLVNGSRIKTFLKTDQGLIDDASRIVRGNLQRRAVQPIPFSRVRTYSDAQATARVA
jgi:hypothetical protein